MATKRLTELTIERVRPVPGKRLDLYDGKVPGLQLRVTDRGVKSFSLLYRVNGIQRRLTIGRWPAVRLLEARLKAYEALEKAERGEDPAGDPSARRPAREKTVADVASLYVDLHCRRNNLRRTADVERMLKGAVLPAWGSRRIRDITHADALDLIDGIAARGAKHGRPAPVMANRTQALLKRLFTFAVERTIIDVSPIGSMKQPAKERSREKVLEPGELGAIWRASEELGWPFCPIVRLLILTAARRSEVCGMRWQDLNLSRGLWTKPAELTKSGREQKLPLPQAAIALINELPVIGNSPWVFPALRGRSHVNSFSRPKARLDKESGVTGWRIHDLRRTAASGLAEDCEVQPHVIATILHHSPAAIAGTSQTARYNRYSYEKEARSALELWAAHVEALAAGGARKVVAMGGRKA